MLFRSSQNLREIDFAVGFGEQGAVQHQRLGIAAFLDQAFQFAVDGAVAQDGPDIERGQRVEAARSAR